MINSIRGMLGLIGVSLRGLRQRKARTILTIMGVMVGVAAMISVNITDEAAQRSISDTFGDAAGEANFIITNATASIRDTAGFDAGVLAYVRETLGVELAAPLLQLTTSSSQELEDWEVDINISNINGTLLYGLDPASSSAIGHYQVVSGEDLGEDSGDGVLVTRSYADSLGIGLGDTLQMAIPGGTKDFEVIGLINSKGLAQLNTGKVVLANLDTIASITRRQGKLDQIDVKAGTGVDVQRLSQSLSTVLGPGYSVTPPQVKGEQTDDVARLIADGLSFIAMLVVAVGILLIYSTFTTAMAERSREMGLMRAIGAGKSHLIGIVLGEAFLLGLLGTLLGIPLGIGLARGMGRIIEETTNTQMNAPTLLPEHIIFALVIGVGIAIIASLIPAIQSGRLSPMEALAQHRDTSRDRSRRKLVLGSVLLGTGVIIFIYHFFWDSDITFKMAFGVVLIAVAGIILLLAEAIPSLEHIISKFLGVFGSLGGIGGRNLGRRPLRSALTAGILVIGITAIVLIGGVNDSQQEYNGRYIEKMIGSDLMVFSPQPFPREIVADIDAMPGVKRATGTGFIPANMVDHGGNGEIAGIFYAFDPTTYDENLWGYDWVDFAGSKSEALAKVESGSAVFIESYTAEHYGFTVGDSIILETLEGKQSFDIAAVVYGRTLSGFGVMGSWDNALKYYGTTNVTSAKIKLNPGYDVSTIKSDISERWGEVYHLKVETFKDYYDRIMSDLDDLNNTADVMQLIAFVVVAMAIINTLLMNVWERRRELGMLRAIGTTRMQLVGSIAAEGVAIGLLGGVIGIGLGLFALPTVIDSWDAMLQTGIEYPNVFPYQSVFVALWIAMIVSMVASLLPAWKGANTNIVEAMRTE